MEEIKVSSTKGRALTYAELLPQLESLVAGENDFVANLANISAALKQALPYASWVGFYLAKGSQLVVGPFQGKVACTRIKIGSGVCGAAAEQKKAIIVPNVYEFPGHIFCDQDSKSEIVVPILKNGNVIGILDLDSSEFDSFSEIDADNLKRVADIVVNLTEVDDRR